MTSPTSPLVHRHDEPDTHVEGVIHVPDRDDALRLKMREYPALREVVGPDDGLDACRQHARDVLIQPAAGDVADALDVEPELFDQVQDLLDIRCASASKAPRPASRRTPAPWRSETPASGPGPSGPEKSRWRWRPEEERPMSRSPGTMVLPSMIFSRSTTPTAKPAMSYSSSV